MLSSNASRAADFGESIRPCFSSSYDDVCSVKLRWAGELGLGGRAGSCRNRDDTPWMFLLHAGPPGQGCMPLVQLLHVFALVGHSYLPSVSSTDTVWHRCAVRTSGVGESCDRWAVASLDPGWAW